MMRLSLRHELYKLRELIHFFLDGAGVTPRGSHGELLCYFCKKLLDDNTSFVTHGNTTGPAFTAKITIHHLSGDHDDNRRDNKAGCHTSCHKAYHRREANLRRAMAARAKVVEVTQENR